MSAGAVVPQFGQAESLGSLLENAHHGELQSVDLQGLADGGFGVVEQSGSQFVVEQSDLLAEGDIARIHETAGEQLEVADIRVVLVGAEHADVAFAAFDDDAVGGVDDRAGGVDPAAEFAADGFDVGEFDEVGVGLAGVLRAGVVVGGDQVRADPADAIENEIAAGDRDGDDQNDGGISDQEAKGRQQSTDAVGLQRPVAEPEGFSKELPRRHPTSVCHGSRVKRPC